jgi:hypothetical protein
MYLRAKKVIAAFFLVCVIAISASAVAAPRTRDTQPSLPQKIVRFLDQLRRLLPTVNDEITVPKP